VLQQVLTHRQGRTTLLISHRPSVIERADWIVMLDRGHLKVQGPRPQVLAEVGNHLAALYGETDSQA
jgi:ATP-binding cassette subfamily C protein